MQNQIIEEIISHFNNIEHWNTKKKEYSAVLSGEKIIVKYKGSIEENIQVLADGTIVHKGMTFSTYGEWLYWYDI